ncbi:outer-membrane lipoprotein carrier protein LolA [Deltaproteobacteria bacterium OttesenSCG-928-M10]|nr:outer-membrane lipoprotein carrier protein LolA [Deltaproteobacteria bacterium OttesenSCG-928-M10]
MTNIKSIRLYAAALAVAVLFTAWPVRAQSLNQDQILAGLSSRYRTLETLQANYRRVASTPSTDQLFKSGSSQVATGVLCWSRPDKLLLNQGSPSREIMVTDGSTVWWYLAEEKLAYRYQDIDVANQLRPLMSFLGGLDSLNAEFNVAPAPAEPERPGQFGLTLTPKQGLEGGVDLITIWCDRAYALTGFRLHSVTGETTDFHLSAFTENPKLDKKIFSFKPPRGTEIIEEE